jgi:hypothetical protein
MHTRFTARGIALLGCEPAVFVLAGNGHFNGILLVLPLLGTAGKRLYRHRQFP